MQPKSAGILCVCAGALAILLVLVWNAQTNRDPESTGLPSTQLTANAESDRPQKNPISGESVRSNPATVADAYCATATFVDDQGMTIDRPVEVYDGQDLLSAVIPEIGVPTRLEVPHGCESLRFEVAGFESVTRLLRSDAGDCVELGRIQFAGKHVAVLLVELQGFTEDHVKRTTVSYFYFDPTARSGTMSRKRPSGDSKRSVVAFEVQTNRAMTVIAAGPGMRIVTEVASLTRPGDIRLVVLRSADVCRHSIRLSSSADRRVLSGQSVILTFYPDVDRSKASRSNVEAVGAAIFGQTNGSAIVDFVGMEAGRFELALATPHGQVRLQDNDTNAKQWIACEDTNLVVSPSEALLGVLVDHEGDVPSSTRITSFALDGGSMFDAGIPLGQVLLLDQTQIGTATELTLLTSEGQRYRKFIRDLPLIGDQLVRFTIQPSMVSAGSLKLVLSSEPRSGTKLILRPATLAAASTSQYELRFAGGTCHVENVREGEYLVEWRWTSCSGVLPNVVRVEPFRETIVVLQLPDYGEYPGRVINWVDIPPDMRPRQIELLGASADIADGSFQLAVTLPILKEATFIAVGGQRVPESSSISVAGDGRLEVLYPSDRFVLAQLHINGVHVSGRLVAEYYPDPDTQPALVTHSSKLRQIARASDDGTISVLVRTGRPLGGWIWEYHGRERMLRGWFHCDGHEERRVLSCPGRYVDMLPASTSISVELLVQGPKIINWTPPAVFYRVLSSIEPSRLWIPDDATSVLLLLDGAEVARIGIDSSMSVIDVREHLR